LPYDLEDVRLSRYMFVQNMIKLSAAVNELHTKNTYSGEKNTVGHYTARTVTMSDIHTPSYRQLILTITSYEIMPDSHRKTIDIMKNKRGGDVSERFKSNCQFMHGPLNPLAQFYGHMLMVFRTPWFMILKHLWLAYIAYIMGVHHTVDRGTCFPTF